MTWGNYNKRSLVSICLPTGKNPLLTMKKGMYNETWSKTYVIRIVSTNTVYIAQDSMMILATRVKVRSFA